MYLQPINTGKIWEVATNYVDDLLSIVLVTTIRSSTISVVKWRPCRHCLASDSH